MISDDKCCGIFNECSGSVLNLNESQFQSHFLFGFYVVILLSLIVARSNFMI